MLNFNNGVNPLQNIADGYKERGTSKPNEVYDEIAALREAYRQDPNALSSVQLLTLGMAELSKKNEAQPQEQQKKANEFRSPHEDQQEEMISTNSEEYQQLERQITEMQAEFKRIKGGGNE